MRTYKTLIKQVLVVVLVLTALKVDAQKMDKAAINGNKGIYVYNVFGPASVKYPDGEVTGFRLYRKAQKDANWQTLSQFSTPTSYEEISKNFEVAKKLVFEYNPTTAYSMEQIWPVYKKTFNFDSVGAFVTQQAMAAAFNVLLIDTTAKKGLTYQYKLAQIKKDGTEALNYTSDPVSTNDAFVANKPIKHGRKADANVVRMEWRAKLKGALPEALLVKRSDGVNMPFKRYAALYDIELKGDSVIYRIEDQHINKEQLYQYTITPVNRFGGGGIAVSDTIFATVIDEHLLTPKIFNVKADSLKNNITLNWSFSQPDFISAVSVYRSTDYENGYQLIGTSAGFNYVDGTAIAGQKYYYYIIVTDKMGRTSPRGVRAYGLLFKGKKSDTPTDVAVNVKNRQNVISWTDINNDTRGYYVYRTNKFEGELIPITEMIYRDSKAGDRFSYTDTATNLSGKVGYSVVSESLSNLRSELSTTVYVEGLKTAPTAPTLIDFKKGGNNIYLFWLNKANDDAITGYNIYRKVGKADFVKLNKVPVVAFKTSYKDSLLLNDQELSYKISSISTTGIESSLSDEMEVQTAQMVYAPTTLKSFFGQDNKSVILQWQPSQSEVANYEIYRYQRGAEPVKIATVAAKILTFTDTNFSKEKNNYYFIKTIGVNGKVSQPSDETFKIVADK